MRRGRSILAVLLAVCVFFHSTIAVYAVGESNVSLTEAGGHETTETGSETGKEAGGPVEGNGEQTGTGSETGKETGEPVEGSGEQTGTGSETDVETGEPVEGSGEQTGTGSETDIEAGAPAEGSGEQTGTGSETDIEAGAPAEGSEEQDDSQDGTEEGTGTSTAEEEEGTESELPEETEESAARILEAKANDLVPNGTEVKIIEPEVVCQSYGKIWLEWKIKLVGGVIGGNIHQCKIYRAETEDGDYQCIGESEAFNPVWADEPMRYRDNTVGQETGSAQNKTYYYKVSVLYDKDNPDETDTENRYIACESELSAPVNNTGLYYSLGNGGGEEGYVGGCIADENGNRLDALTLTEGVPKKLKAAWIKEDGSLQIFNKVCYGGWYLCERYHTSEEADEEYSTGSLDGHVMSLLGGNQVQILPEMEERNGEIVCKDWEVNLTVLPGTARDSVYYLTLVTGNNVGAYTWQIPVRVEAGDGTYNPPQSAYVYQTKEELCQAIRDIMVNRTQKATIYSPVGLEDWQIPGTGIENPDGGEFIPPDYDFEDIYDFHRERADMKPYEGDYLLLAIGKADEVVSYNNWLTLGYEFHFNQTGYYKYEVTPSFITTRAQEDWVDQQIDQIIRQPGGALYQYQNASEFAKIKAAYNYVKNNVSYIGSTTPIYHTCYSALKNKKATCQGYALLFYRLARELGIPNRVLMGTDANAHTYNIVKLGDAWYYLDTSAGVFLQGENDFQHTQLQSHYLTDSFQNEYLSKISKTSYNGSAEAVTSTLSGIQALTDTELKAIDANLLSAANLSASYDMSNTAIKASGTVRYMQGCSGYLGYEADKNMPTAGYFLAARLTADASKFTEDGCLRISYAQRDGQRAEKIYRKADSTLAQGYVDVILDITKPEQEIVITVDYDTAVEENSKFEPVAYRLNLTGVKRETIDQCTGNVTEISEYGIELSSPLVQKSKDGSEITVSYEAVAHSAKVELPGKQLASGNYVALQLSTPECVKGTAMLKGTTVTDSTPTGSDAGTTPQETKECVIEIDKTDYAHIRFFLPIEGSLSKEFTINWGGSHSLAWNQKLIVKTTQDCILETLNANALLPGSIALNGLVSTMYVGQSQCIHTTINKKYEQDITQLFYTSAASDIVAVNRVTGVMKALKAGTAEISVSAIDKTGTTIKKTAKITVKELTAPAGMKVSGIKDTCVTLNWKSNPTGQYMEVYAIPYKEAVFGAKKTDWKNVAERGLAAAGMAERTLASCSDAEKTAMLNSLKGSLNTNDCLAAWVTSDQKEFTVQGLQPETEYIFYFRNTSAVTAQTVAFAGAVSDKCKTKSKTFAKVQLKVDFAGTSGITQTTENNVSVYTVTTAGQSVSATLSYQFLNADGNEITGEVPEFKKAAFKSSNQKIVKIKESRDDKTIGMLEYGAQVGDAELFVTGKDSSDTLRQSNSIIIRVVKAPSKLVKKTTTMTVGQSIRLAELIGTDLKGSVNGMDLTQIDFNTVLQSILGSGCFIASDAGNATQDTEITAVALPADNKGLTVTFKMGDSEADATIKVKDMAAPVIGKVTVRDTSAVIAFKPSTTVEELSTVKYYSLTLIDKTTKEKVLENAAAYSPNQEYTAGNYTYSFCTEPTWSCEVKGLSSDKQYEAVITAHFDADNKQNAKASKGKTVKTSKPLLVSEGSIGINYISMEELRANPNAAGTAIDYAEEAGIYIENNGTYVFMAQVSNLARTLETDKLKWAISSGDKKAAKVKAASSTFEMQLTTSRTGTFTVTATSTVTKEAVATFKVNVIPYQSGGRQTTPNGATSNEVAYVPETVGIRRWEEDAEELAC